MKNGYAVEKSSLSLAEETEPPGSVLIPKFTLELAELYRLKQVVIRGHGMPRQICNGAGYSQNTVKCTGRQRELLYRR